jgi:hypothetical protein
MNAGGDMYMVCNTAVVIDGTARVQNDILADICAGVENSAGTGHCPITDPDLVGNDGGWVQGADQARACGPQTIKHLLASAVVANPNDGSVVRNIRQIGDRAENWEAQPEQRVLLRGVIQEANRSNRLASLLHIQQNVGDNLPMATGANDQDTPGHGVRLP